MGYEVLFRAKQIANPKNFAYGFYLFDVNREFKHLIVDFEGVYHPIQIDTLGQYIGAIDNEGNKIFVGDILYDSFEHIYDEVIFLSEMASFSLCRNDLDIVNGVVRDWDGVAGNIYDNPKLLEMSN